MKLNIFRAADMAGSGGGASSADAGEAEAGAAARAPAGGDTALLGPIKVSARSVSVLYGEKQALIDVSLEIPDKTVTAFIGPSGCGKSTFLRCINRMNDTIPAAKVTGGILIDGEDVRARWTGLSKARCAAPASGTRSPTASTRRAPVCPAVSSSVWSSLAPSRSSLK